MRNVTTKGLTSVPIKLHTHHEINHNTIDVAVFVYLLMAGTDYILVQLKKNSGLSSLRPLLTNT